MNSVRVHGKERKGVTNMRLRIKSGQVSCNEIREWPNGYVKVTVKSWLLFGEVISLVLCACILSRSVVSNSVTPRTAAHQTPLSVGFARQEYWSGLPFPPPGDRPDSGIEPRSLLHCR